MRKYVTGIFVGVVGFGSGDRGGVVGVMVNGFRGLWRECCDPRACGSRMTYGGVVGFGVVVGVLRGGLGEAFVAFGDVVAAVDSFGGFEDDYVRLYGVYGFRIVYAIVAPDEVDIAHAFG